MIHSPLTTKVMGMEIEVVNSISTRKRSNRVSNTTLCGSVKDVFSHPDADVPDSGDMLRSVLGVSCGTVKFADGNHIGLQPNVHALDDALELQLLSVPEVGVSDAVRFIHLVVAINAMELQ